MQLISLEHDLCSEMGLFGGVIAHAHLQHPLGLHPPHVLHVLLLLAHKAFTCKRRHGLNSQWCRNKVNYHQTAPEKPNLPKSPAHPSALYCLRTRPTAFWL